MPRIGTALFTSFMHCQFREMVLAHRERNRDCMVMRIQIYTRSDCMLLDLIVEDWDDISITPGPISEEVCAHLGAETQRQWSDKAIARTTPMLFGLFSWITLVAHLLVQQNQVKVRQIAWYRKLVATFSDAIAWVRHRFWSTEAEMTFQWSIKQTR